MYGLRELYYDQRQGKSTDGANILRKSFVGTKSHMLVKMLSWMNKLKKQLMTSITSIVVEFGASHAADLNIIYSMLWWEYLQIVRVLLTERGH